MAPATIAATPRQREVAIGEAEERRTVQGQRAAEPGERDKRGRPEDRPLPWRGAVRDANEPEVPPGRNGSPEVQRLAVVGQEQPGLDLGEAVASERLVPVFALEVGDTRVDEEPARRPVQVEHVPRERSVKPGVAGPAGRLVTLSGHGGVGDEARKSSRGRERQVGILDRRPPGQRQQPIAIRTRLAEEVGEDRRGELVLELMVLGVGEDGDSDPDLRHPPEV